MQCQLLAGKSTFFETRCPKVRSGLVGHTSVGWSATNYIYQSRLSDDRKVTHDADSRCKFHEDNILGKKMLFKSANASYLSHGEQFLTGWARTNIVIDIVR